MAAVSRSSTSEIGSMEKAFQQYSSFIMKYFSSSIDLNLKKSHYSNCHVWQKLIFFYPSKQILLHICHIYPVTQDRELIREFQVLISSQNMFTRLKKYCLN